MGRIKFEYTRHQTPAARSNSLVPALYPKARCGWKIFCEYLSDSCSLTSADVKGAIEALTTYIGRNLSNGY